MEYFNSFEFWLHVMWASSAVGFGLTLGYFLYIGVMDLAAMLLERLLNLKFKKMDREKQVVKSSDMDETDYLLSSENNKEHLKKSIEQTDIKNTSYVDSDIVVRLMEGMTISELKVLKSACDLLIGFKNNERLK